MTRIGKEPSSRRQRLHAAKDYGFPAWLPHSLQLQGFLLLRLSAYHGAAVLVALESSPNRVQRMDIRFCRRDASPAQREVRTKPRRAHLVPEGG